MKLIIILLTNIFSSLFLAQFLINYAASFGNLILLVAILPIFVLVIAFNLTILILTERTRRWK